jgi:pimeloyl-ACP methyl ester carboxylesterase
VAGLHEINDDRCVIVLAVLAGLLALGVLYQQIGARQDRRQFPAPGSFVDVGGHRVHAHCRGEGSPLVLLEAGIAASSLSWAVVQPAIAAFTRVCAYDRAGLAWSDTPSCDRTAENVLSELSALLAAIGDRDRVVLVGHSFGSLIVRTYAARHPERVAGIVLVDPPIEWLSLTPERAYRLRRGRVLSNVGAWLAHAGVVRACLDLVMRGAGRGAAAIRHSLRPTRGTDARAVRRRGEEAACRRASHRQSDLVSAEVLSRDGGLSADPRAGRKPPHRRAAAARAGGRHFRRGISPRTASPRTGVGRAVGTRPSRHRAPKRPLGAVSTSPELIVSEVRALVESGRRYTSPLPT